VLSGSVEARVESRDGFDWVPVGPGETFYAPGNARHGFRNRGREPAVMIITTGEGIARFFREVGRPVGSHRGSSSPKKPEAIDHFVEVAERYGHWLAPPPD
jgi:hypothetical protein